MKTVGIKMIMNGCIVCFKDKTLDALATVRPTEGVHVDVSKWLDRDPNHSFASWRRRMHSKEAEIAPAKPSTKVRLFVFLNLNIFLSRANLFYF